MIDNRPRNGHRRVRWDIKMNLSLLKFEILYKSAYILAAYHSVKSRSIITGRISMSKRLAAMSRYAVDSSVGRKDHVLCTYYACGNLDLDSGAFVDWVARRNADVNT